MTTQVQTQEPLRKTLATAVKPCLGNVHPRGGIDEACVDRWGIDAIRRHNT